MRMNKKLCCHNGCNSEADVKVKFKNPMETIEYCMDHAKVHFERNGSAYTIKPLDR